MLLRVGSRGSEVVKVQEALNNGGYGPLDTDGIFGRGTEAAVKRFQKDAGVSVDGIVGPNTMAAIEAKGEKVQPAVSDEMPASVKAIEALGYKVFTDGQINIIGIRSDNPMSNSFDDEMHLAWVKNGLWQHHKYRCTCDPGTFWLENPSRSEGTAILVPGQYENVYEFGMHRGKYKALCQKGGRVSVWRDSNKDDMLDWEEGNEGISGYYGINIHHAGTDSTNVDKWSAGCQVFARMVDWNEALSIWEASGASSFTYTLITAGDLAKEIS
tara:strand:- start:504 stop:1313 length:810 start_codon:yes stop_codon:yes gene_type:complete